MSTAELDQALRLSRAERRWLADARDRLRSTRNRTERLVPPARDETAGAAR